MSSAKWLPNAITTAGWVLGCVGILASSPVALALSLACDVADGAVARRWGLVSAFGARFDFACDVALAQAAVWTFMPPITAATVGSALVLVHALQPALARPVSGRALVFAVTIGMVL